MAEKLMAEVNRVDPIGLPLDRVDGQLKVTGRATYAYEYATQGGAAYGVIVSAETAKGRVAGVDGHARRQFGRRLRSCVRHRTGEDRGDLYHTLSEPSPNGAACNDGDVGWGNADGPYVSAADHKPTGRPPPDIQHSQGERPHHSPLRRRRLRQQIAILCRRDARGNRRPHPPSTCESGDDTPAALS